MKRQTATYLLFLFAYFLLITLFRRWFSLSYWPFWLGGLVGIFLPGIDHIIYVYLLNPFDLTSQRVSLLIKEKKIKQAVMLLYDTRHERVKLIFHTAFFQVIFLVLTFLVASSSGSLFGKGMVLAASLHLLVDQIDDYFTKGSLLFWFRANPFMGELVLDKQQTLGYWIIIFLANLFIAFVT